MTKTKFKDLINEIADIPSMNNMQKFLEIQHAAKIFGFKSDTDLFDSIFGNGTYEKIVTDDSPMGKVNLTILCTKLYLGD